MSITTFLKTKLLMHDAETDEIFVNLIHLSAFLDPEPVLRSDHSIELFEAQMRFLRMLTMAQRQSLHRFVGRLSSALVKFHVTVDGEFWDRLWPRGLLIKRWDLEPRWMYHSPGFLPWLVADQLLRQISLRNLFEFIMALGDDSRAPLSPSNHGCVRPYPLGPYGVIELWTSKAQMDPLAYLAMSAQRGNRRPWYRTWIGGADPWEDVRIGWLFRGRGDDVDGADAQPDFDFTTMMPVEMP
ncbi:MAG: hypothetical protein M1817_002635 [Caeruleum heppii]|nr:MAG: hypothetical protein M1817_002635 [Caeruleum heppii]